MHEIFSIATYLGRMIDLGLGDVGWVALWQDASEGYLALAAFSGAGWMV